MERKTKKVLKIIVIILILSLIAIIPLKIWLIETDANLKLLAIGTLLSILLGGYNMLRYLMGYRTAEASLKKQIRDGFSSEEMGKAMRKLWDFKRKHGSDFANKFGEMLPQEYIQEENLAEEQRKAQQIDQYRRNYSQHFFWIWTLLDDVSEKFIKTSVPVDEVELLLEVVEPLEKVKNPHYDKRMFDEFRRMYKKELQHD